MVVILSNTSLHTWFVSVGSMFVLSSNNLTSSIFSPLTAECKRLLPFWNRKTNFYTLLTCIVQFSTEVIILIFVILKWNITWERYVRNKINIRYTSEITNSNFMKTIRTTSPNFNFVLLKINIGLVSLKRKIMITNITSEV